MSRGLVERARGFRKSPTVAEKALWKVLRNRALGGYKFRRQHPIDDRFVADFICLQARLIIEVDGDIHLDQQEYDAYREQELAALGFRVIRFHNEDVLLNIEAVKDAIYNTLTQRA